MKQGSREILINIVLGGALLLLLALSMMLIVWKEKQLRDFYLEQEGLRKELTVLKGREASLGLNIERLSANTRLEKYALDSLGMILPNSEEIINIRKNRRGVVIAPHSGAKGFILRLVGKE